MWIGRRGLGLVIVAFLVVLLGAYLVDGEDPEPTHEPTHEWTSGGRGAAVLQGRSPAHEPAAAAELESGTAGEAAARVVRREPAGSVFGRVSADEGLEGVEVRLCATKGRVPVHPFVDTCVVGEDGAFRLRVVEDGAYAVVAWEGASRALLPAVSIVDLEADEDRDVGTLFLERGVVLAGTLRRQGVGVSGASLRALAQGGGRRLRWVEGQAARGTLRWVDGRLVPEPARVRTQEGGTWRLEGIAPGSYLVEVSHVPRLKLHPELAKVLRRDVRAPDESVLLEIDGAELRLLVRSLGRHLEDAWVEVSSGWGEIGSRTRGDGAVFALLAWDVTYEIRVEAPDHEHATITLHPVAGRWEPEHVVELEPRAPRPSLVVTLVKPDGEPVCDVGFGLFREGDDGGEPWRVLDFEGAKGAFQIPELEAGRYRLVVRPDGQWSHGSGLCLPSEHEVEIRNTGEVRLQVTVRTAGTLRLEALDETGAHLPATCVVKTAEGERVDLWFRWVTPGGGRGGSVARLDTRGPCHTYPGLPTGRYRVELAYEGYLSQTHDVEVRAGAVTPLTVTLVRE